MTFSALSAIFLVSVFLLRNRLIGAGEGISQWLEGRNRFIQYVCWAVYVVIGIEIIVTIFISVVGLLLPIVFGAPKHGNDLGEALRMYLVMVTVLPLATGGITAIVMGYFLLFALINEHVQAPGFVLGFLELVAVLAWTALWGAGVIGLLAVFGR